MKLTIRIFLSFLLIGVMYIFAFSLSYIYISQINQLSMEIEPLSYEISVLQEQIESNTILETAITSYTLIESKELEEFITGYANQTGEKIRDLGEKDRNELLQPLSRLDEQIGLLVNSIKGKITSSELNYQILNTYAAYEALGKKEREILEKDTQKLHDIIDAQKGIIILLGILFTGSGISIFLLAFFLSLVLGKKITGPLSKLEKVMSEIAQGKLDSVIEIKSEDEIGSLARSFDTMRRGIKAYQKQLKEYGKKLEIKVKERTKELEEKNTELERFNRLAVGRELKMIEMKKKISELEGSR